MKLFTLLLAAFLSLSAEAKQFPVFDGMSYNGLFYPLVDIIEWGDELKHLEFHLHDKTKYPMDVSVAVGELNGRAVVFMNYNLKFRGEHACRHAPAPMHFKKGIKLYSYRDSSIDSYENIYISSEPMKTSKTMVAFDMEPYYICPNDETASNMPEGPLPPGATPAATPASAPTAPATDKPRAPASEDGAIEAFRPDGSKKEGKGVNVDYENTALPFSF